MIDALAEPVPGALRDALEAAPRSAGLASACDCFVDTFVGIDLLASYKDTLLLPDGLQLVQLKEGLVNGTARIQFKGQGINLRPPALPLVLPVTVQVKNTDTDVCREAVYTTATTNDGVQFKPKGD